MPSPEFIAEMMTTWSAWVDIVPTRHLSVPYTITVFVEPPEFVPEPPPELQALSAYCMLNQHAICGGTRTESGKAGAGPRVPCECPHHQ